MRLILLRHADAIDREAWHGEDADRPLTRDGAKRLKGVLKALRPLVDADEILTSPWLRARATAELAASVWNLPLREADWLAGGAADAAEGIAELRALGEPVLVGHEPDLGELIGALIGAKAVPLKKAGVAVLEGEAAPGGMRIVAVLSPKVVEALTE